VAAVVVALELPGAVLESPLSSSNIQLSAA
jgi:hypothetical protein